MYDLAVSDAERDDLAAMFARITRRLGDAERPLLERHGLTMWEYIVLSRLARRPVETQLELARRIGYDKTRLIALLDRLQSEGLIEREPDAADRRARNVRITKSGERRRAAAQRDIRAMEDRALAELSADDRQTLLAILQRLALSAQDQDVSSPVSRAQGPQLDTSSERHQRGHKSRT